MSFFSTTPKAAPAKPRPIVGPLMSLRNLEKVFETPAGRMYVLRRITADIQPGEFISVMGPSGAGKSTLLDLIRGALLPDDGDIYVPRSWRIGFLAQEAPGGERSPLDTVLAADRERAKAQLQRDHGAAQQQQQIGAEMTAADHVPSGALAARPVSRRQTTPIAWLQAI